MAQGRDSQPQPREGTNYPKVIDPTVHMITQLDDISIILNDSMELLLSNNKLLQAMQEEGKLENYSDLTVMGGTRDMVLTFVHALFGVSVINKGNSVVYVGVNEPIKDKNLRDLDGGQSFDVSFQTAKIKRVYLRCEPNTGTQVDILGRY